MLVQTPVWKKLNLDKPVTFNEKIQWLKLYDRKPEYSKMVDKYEVKKYVADVIGEQYVIPVLGVWDKFDDIDFDKLPDQFVLKCTHDSGGVIICNDKQKFDANVVRKKINKSLKRNYYLLGREWPYKNVKPRIIAEQYINSLKAKNLVEYKIFCFNGIAKMVLVCKGEAHSNNRTNDYCDLNLKRLPFTCFYPNSIGDIECPAKMSKLISLAEKLSDGIPHVRVDMYITDEEIYFGEMTFYHNAGLQLFEPGLWDEKIGEWLDLPIKEN